jgi:hypothetical protein
MAGARATTFRRTPRAQIWWRSAVALPMPDDAPVTRTVWVIVPPPEREACSSVLPFSLGRDDSLGAPLAAEVELPQLGGLLERSAVEATGRDPPT